ncbi:MAG: type IV pilin N-terminal domain-containing protein [Thermoplasmatota archaeon]
MQNRKADAVSEIIATVLLLAVAISVFSVIYVVVLSAPMPSEQSTAIISGDIIDNQIVLTHQGGKSLTIDEESYQIQTTAGEYTDFIFNDFNDNGLWDIGEQVRFIYDDLTEKQVTVTVVDVATNEVVLYGVLQEGETSI